MSTSCSSIGIAVSTCNGAGDDQKHTLFLKSDGTVWYVGVINYSSVGNLSTTNVPTVIPGLSNVVGIQVGSDSSYFLFADGSVSVVGYNGQGELGIGDTSTKSAITKNLASGMTSGSSRYYKYFEIANGFVYGIW